MANVPKDVAYVMKQMGIKSWETFKELMKGPLSKQLSEGLTNYRSGDFGEASKQAVQAGSSGRVQPTAQETFAGRPVPISQDDSLKGSETFGAGFTPIQTERSTEKPPESAVQEKRKSPYTRSTALKDSEGNQLTEESLTKLNDADITERYTVFFGEKPKDAKVARSELLDLFKSFSKSVSPVLN